MKSKTLNLGHTSVDRLKQNRTFEFVNLYKSSSETSASFSAKPHTSDAHDTTTHKVKSESPKRERSPNKRKKVEKRESIDISHITIDGPGLNSNNVGSSTPMNESKVTSTPVVNRKLQGKSSKVKSIMKNSLVVTDDAMDGSNLDTSSSKPKKRNKSVSFMLGDNEEVVNKKTKSDDSTNESNSDTTTKLKAKRSYKKAKKERLAEKENKADVNQQTMGTEDAVKEKAKKNSKAKHEKSKTLHATPDDVAGQTSQTANAGETKKKYKKAKETKPDESTEYKDNTSQKVPDKIKKTKKKKHQEKLTEPENEEPASKSRKKESKPDVVMELENLCIGDNAHTLTNMLDEMTVADKDKRKKLKRKLNKNKKAKGAKPEDVQDSGKTEDLQASEKTEDIPEKVKWIRRKWNKDGKADAKEASLDTTVIVENLPLSMLFSYKKILAEHFVKYGLIRSVGIAEVYPGKVSKPVFTTTVNFHSEGAATQALADDTVFEGSQVEVKPALPPTETTLVVRSYGLLTTQCISSMFSGAGRIRNIRHLVKGKHSMATFFIEFDGLKSVERALKLATDAKVGGKKVYTSRFELRTKKTKQKPKDNDSDADQSDSQD